MQLIAKFVVYRGNLCLLTINTGKCLTILCFIYKTLVVILPIDQFRYIKFQLKTVDLRTRLWGISPTDSVVIYSPEPRSEVFCLRLNFNISKLVYCWFALSRNQK